MNDYGYYLPEYREYSARKRTPLEDIRRIHGDNRPEFKYHVVSELAWKKPVAAFNDINDAVAFVRDHAPDMLIKVA